jgi:hypothetical protein
MGTWHRIHRESTPLHNQHLNYQILIPFQCYKYMAIIWVRRGFPFLVWNINFKYCHYSPYQHLVLKGNYVQNSKPKLILDIRGRPITGRISYAQMNSEFTCWILVIHYLEIIRVSHSCQVVQAEANLEPLHVSLINYSTRRTRPLGGEFGLLHRLY